MAPIPRILLRPSTLKNLSPTTRKFSILTRVRQLARSAEAHPFERYPTTAQAQKPDYGRLGRRVGDSAMFYFPFMALFLTWPIIGEKIVERLQ